MLYSLDSVNWTITLLKKGEKFLNRILQFMTSNCLTNCIRTQTFLDSTGLVPNVHLVKPLNYIVTLNETRLIKNICWWEWFLEKEAGDPSEEVGNIDSKWAQLHHVPWKELLRMFKSCKYIFCYRLSEHSMMRSYWKVTQSAILPILEAPHRICVGCTSWYFLLPKITVMQWGFEFTIYLFLD